MEKSNPELNYDTAVNFLPNMAEKYHIRDDKFLFFFDPKIVDAKFLFGLPLKTGVYIFSVVVIIQSLNSFFQIFKPNSFWIFLVSILSFLVYLVIAFYAVLGALKDDYSFLKISYTITAVIFLIQALKYICKSVYKTIEFITPWDGDFLKLDFLIYIFGYGVYLLLYLYLIYILYKCMIQTNKGENPKKNDENNNNNNILSDLNIEEQIQCNEDDIKKND